jgi:hypothetical protein
LPEGCQYLLPPVRNFNNLWHICKRVAPIAHKGATCACAIPLKKVKFKVKSKEAINIYKKNYQRFITK